MIVSPQIDDGGMKASALLNSHGRELHQPVIINKISTSVMRLSEDHNKVIKREIMSKILVPAYPGPFLLHTVVQKSSVLWN